MPCLITALAELNDPRYMTPGGIFDACEAEILTMGRADLVDVEDGNIGLNGSPTKIAKASDKVRKGAGEKVTTDSDPKMQSQIQSRANLLRSMTFNEGGENENEFRRQYKGVFVFAQQVDNQVSGIAYELLGKAKELAQPLNTQVTAVLIGYQVKDLADQLAEYGADRVIVVDDPELKEYRTEPYAHALSSVINEYKPDIMLVGATAIGRDLGPTVSARVKTGLTADCTVLEIGDFPLQPRSGAEAQPASYDPSCIRWKHHRYHRMSG